MDMLRCGPTRPNVCVVLVITDDKLSVKYDNLRKRSEEGKIVFTFVSDYFYRYHFYFFDYRYCFRLGLKIRKKLKNDFQKSEIIIFDFIPSIHTIHIRRSLGWYQWPPGKGWISSPKSNAQGATQNGRNFFFTVPFRFLYFLVHFRICEIPFSYLRK
jgi:hypothetical protein